MKRAFKSPNDPTIHTQQLPATRKYIPSSTIEQQSHHSSDGELHMLIQRIEGCAFFRSQGRHVRIRLQSWLYILGRNEFNSVWRQNRLNCLKLLSLMCHCEYITHPFTAFPKNDTLPLLQKHQIDRIIDQVEKEVRNSKLTTKRQDYPFNDPTHSHNGRRNSQQMKRRSMIKHFLPSLGNQNTKSQKHKETDRFYQYKGNVVTHKKQKFQIVLQKPTISKASPSITVQKTDNKDANHHNTINMHTFYADHDQSNLARRKQQQVDWKKPSPKRRNNNSIAQSVSLQLSPISVSSKIWQITHKKPSKPVLMNRTFDHSNMNPTTFQSSKHPRVSHPVHFSAQEEEYSTGEGLRVARQQYWETNTYTGNGTPKYMSSLNQIPNITIVSSEAYEHQQQHMECCFCDQFGVF